MGMTKSGVEKRKQTYIDKYGSWEAYVEVCHINGRKAAEKYERQKKAGIAPLRGFAARKDLAVISGAKGGRISRRGKKS